MANLIFWSVYERNSWFKTQALEFVKTVFMKSFYLLCALGAFFYNSVIYAASLKTDGACFDLVQKIESLKSRQRMTWDDDIIKASFSYLYSHHENSEVLTRDVLIKNSDEKANELLSSFLGRDIKTQALLKAAQRSTGLSKWEDIEKFYDIKVFARPKLVWNKDKLKKVFEYLLEHHSNPQSVTMSSLKRNQDKEASDLISQYFGYPMTSTVLANGARKVLGTENWEEVKKALYIARFNSGVMRWNEQNLQEAMQYLLKFHSAPETLVQDSFRFNLDNEATELLRKFTKREVTTNSFLYGAKRHLADFQFDQFKSEVISTLPKRYNISVQKEFARRLKVSMFQGLSVNERDDKLKDMAFKYFEEIIEKERLRGWIKKFNYNFYNNIYDVPSDISKKNLFIKELKQLRPLEGTPFENIAKAREILLKYYKNDISISLFRNYIKEAFPLDYEKFYLKRATEKDFERIKSILDSRGYPKKTNILNNHIFLAEVFREVVGKDMSKDARIRFITRYYPEDHHLFFRMVYNIRDLGVLVREEYEKINDANFAANTVKENSTALLQAMHTILGDSYNPSKLHMAYWALRMDLNLYDFDLSESVRNSAQLFYDVTVARKVGASEDRSAIVFKDDNGQINYEIEDLSSDVFEEVAAQEELKRATDWIEYYGVENPIVQFILKSIIDANVTNMSLIVKVLAKVYTEDEIQEGLKVLSNDKILSLALLDWAS